MIILIILIILIINNTKHSLAVEKETREKVSEDANKRSPSLSLYLSMLLFDFVCLVGFIMTG